MNSNYLKALGAAACLLLTTPSFGKKWCCEKEGSVQLFPENNKKMCVKSKKAPSAKSKVESKRGKYYAACNELDGKWVAKSKAKSPSK